MRIFQIDYNFSTKFQQSSLIQEVVEFLEQIS